MQNGFIYCWQFNYLYFRNLVRVFLYLYFHAFCLHFIK